MDVNLSFNRKEYTIPKDLQEYLYALNLAEDLQKELCQLFVRKAIASESKVVSPAEMDEALEDAAKRFVQNLCKNNIYDKTIDDYAFKNEGYIEFLNVTKNAMQTMVKYLSEEAQDYEVGKLQAEQKALSSITGSGVNVYSSSILTLALTSAVEYTTLQGQCNKADEQYASDLKLLRKQGASKREQKENEYFTTQYCPEAEAALRKYAYCLMGRYLDDLIAENQFDKETLQYVDLKRSQEILRNLNISPNKEGVLEKAFLACPFNMDVYIELGKLGKLDADTFKAADELGQATFVKQRLYELYESITYTGNLCENLAGAENIIISLSNITGKNKADFYKEFADPIYKNICEKYDRIKEYAKEKTSAQKLLDSFGEKIPACSDEDLRRLATKTVAEIVSIREFDALKSIGYTSLLSDISPDTKDFYDKQTLDTYYIDHIFENLIAALPAKKKEFNDCREKQESKRRNKLNEVKKNKSKEILLSVVLLITPLILIIGLGLLWQSRNEKEVYDFIVSKMHTDNKLTTSWNDVGGISGIEIKDMIYFKEPGQIYVEPTIVYTVGENNISASDIDKIVSEYYWGYQKSVPFYISIFNHFLDLREGKIIVRRPNGQETTIYEGTTNPKRYGESILNPCLPTPFVVVYIIYALIVCIRLWFYMSCYSSLEKKYK